MNEAYGPYQDDVALYVVGVSEPMDVLVADQAELGYPGEIAIPGDDMLRALKVYTLASKIAIDAEGVIVYRAGFGQCVVKSWQEAFAALAASRQDA